MQNKSTSLGCVFIFPDLEQKHVIYRTPIREILLGLESDCDVSASCCHCLLKSTLPCGRRHSGPCRHRYIETHRRPTGMHGRHCSRIWIGPFFLVFSSLSALSHLVLSTFTEGTNLKTRSIFCPQLRQNDD